MRTFIYLIFAWLLALTVVSAVQYAGLNRERVASRADDRAVWHAVVCTIEHAELRNKKITMEQRAQAVQFWTTLLVKKVGTTPCP